MQKWSRNGHKMTTKYTCLMYEKKWLCTLVNLNNSFNFVADVNIMTMAILKLFLVVSAALLTIFIGEQILENFNEFPEEQEYEENSLELKMLMELSHSVKKLSQNVQSLQMKTEEKSPQISHKTEEKSIEIGQITEESNEEDRRLNIDLLEQLGKLHWLPQ